MSDPRLARPLWRGRTNVDAFTIAWIEHAEDIVRERWPKIAHQFVVTQGGYQGFGGDPDSAGTHALGGGTDFTWCGHPECLLALRLAGGFVWHRTPEQGDWVDHIHGAPIGHPLMAPVLARQETSYFDRRNGLANNGPDDGPRLDPIPRPIWPYPEVDIVTEDEMNQVADKVVAKLLAADVGDDRTVKAALRMAAKAPSAARELERLITDRILEALTPSSSGVVDAAVIEDAVKAALREGTG
ncbi:MAG: hypothetical protein ABIR39_16575 [Nocardioides sp.]|uniref:hypothetical protein n=1 Tax=Nocardioides sp. TaxID=35761 RepID=UPI003266AFE5